MAITPLFEQEDTKSIIRILLNSKKSVKELNEYIIQTKEISISTATLYRRIKELYTAGFIEKLDDGSYTASEQGKDVYNELYGKNNNSNKLPDDFKDLIKVMSHQQTNVLQRVQQGPTYTSGLLKEIPISPNDLIDIFKELIRHDLIEIIEKPGKKPGRPKKMYKISEKGLLLIQEIEKLKKKLRKTR